MSRSIVVVYNSRSGGAEDEVTLRRQFEATGLIVERMIAIGDDLSSQLRSYSQQEGYYIAAVGGDGTISSVAAQLVDTPAVLVPIPGGTFNNFTKDLGIAQSVNEAIAAISEASVQTIDVAQVNDRVFINNSSLGVYPRSVVARSQVKKQIGKWPAAVYGMIRSLVRFRAYQVRLNGRPVTTPFVFVGNNDYGEDITPNIRRDLLTGGVIRVYVIAATRRWEFVKTALAAVRYGSAQVPQFMSKLLVHPLMVECPGRRRVHVSCDGEVVSLIPPLRYQSRPLSLRVLVPTR